MIHSLEMLTAAPDAARSILMNNLKLVPDAWLNKDSSVELTYDWVGSPMFSAKPSSLLGLVNRVARTG